MTKGVETDSKRYKHIKRDDEKWLFKDLYDIRKTIKNYINSIRPSEENKIEKSVKKGMSIGRIIAILFLGLFGSIMLIVGIYLIINANYVLGVSLGIFGFVFLVAFFLNEMYR